MISKRNMTKKDVLLMIKKEKIRFVNLQFSDMLGTAKNLTIPAHEFGGSIDNGTWFDGSSIEGFARIFESDMYLVPDLATFRVMPWLTNEAGKSARVICDVHMPNGEPFEGDPRFILKERMAEAEKMGYIFNTGPELEFFLFKRDNGKVSPLPHDQGGYFDLTMDLGYQVREDIVGTLEAMGILVEAAHHEVAVGQHEIDFRYANALTTADSAMTLRSVVKAVSAKYGLHATFMPKPIFGINGSGMHVHQSFTSKRTGKNAFFDAKDKYNLSKIAYSYIAGQLKHVREASAIISPLVNSYKRLTPGYEAPVYIAWARQNRSALIRVPRASKGKSEATRAEIRCPDPTANPYLAFAALLTMGMEGIKKNYVPPKPVEENVYHLDEAAREKRKILTLPHSLWNALDHMKASKLMEKALGSFLYKRYIEAKTAEWDSYRTAVSDWEIDRYLETY